MTTPDQLAAKFDRLSRDLTTKVPIQGTTAAGAIVLAATVAGANRGHPPGGSQVKLKPARARFGNANAMVVGWGFAVLAEHGSWKKPDGWDIFPKGLTNSLKVNIRSGRSREGSSLRGIEQKAMREARRKGYRKIMLGNEAAGMAATYAHHPKKDPEPYVVAAAAASSNGAGRAVDFAVIKSLASIF